MHPFGTLAALVLVAVGAGCDSSQTDNACVATREAEVCVSGPNGDFRIDASGLKPGSTLQLSSDTLGESSYAIADSGTPDGQVGLLGDLEGEVLVISATTESGESLTGTITLET